MTTTTMNNTATSDRIRHIINQITIPGYRMESEHFVLCLVTVCQQDRPNPFLEYRTDWTDVMQIVLMVLETFPESVKRFQTFARMELEAWSAARCRLVCGDSEDCNRLNCHNVRSAVRLTERPFYPEPRGTTKHLSLEFSHREVVTEIVLDVRRKERMRSLAELAAATVAAGVNNVNAMAHLTVSAGWAVKRELGDDWTPAYFDRNCVRPITSGDWQPLATSGGMAGAAPPPPPVVAASQRRDLSKLSACPYCRRNGFRSVRLHVAKNKQCSELWKRDDGLVFAL